MIRARQRARVDVPFDSEAHFRIFVKSPAALATHCA
jgi:hypothetical protein